MRRILHLKSCMAFCSIRLERQTMNIGGLVCSILWLMRREGEGTLIRVKSANFGLFRYERNIRKFKDHLLAVMYRCNTYTRHFLLLHCLFSRITARALQQISRTCMHEPPCSYFSCTRTDGSQRQGFDLTVFRDVHI